MIYGDVWYKDRSRNLLVIGEVELQDRKTIHKRKEQMEIIVVGKDGKTRIITSIEHWEVKIARN